MQRSATVPRVRGILGGVTASDPSLDNLLGHVPWVRSLALQLCRDVHLAEDAAQEACLLAARRPPRDSGRLRAYLAKIVRNLLRLDARAQRRRSRREQAFAALAQTEPADPAELVARAELHGALVEAVLQLPASYREVVLLHYFEGLEVVTIAARIGRSPDAIRALLRRARADLRGALERRGDRCAVVLCSLAGASGPGLATLTTFAMKSKLLVAVAAVLSVGLSLPFLFQSPSGAAAAEPTDRTATATSGSSAEPQVPPLSPESAPVHRVAAPADGRIVTGRLVGLDARLPWSTPLACTAEWQVDGKFERHEFHVEVTPTGDFRGTIAQLPASPPALQVRCQAEDPGYQRLDASLTIAAGSPVSLELQVEPAPILLGRVVAPDGGSIAGVEVLCFAASDGVPRAPHVATATSAADGSWRMRLPAAGEVLAAAVPPANRTDLVVVGVPGAVQGCTDLGEIRFEPVAPITGTVRWQNGTPIAGAELDWRVRVEVTLDQSLGLGWTAGRMVQRRVAIAGGDGRFLLPAAAGEQGSVMVQRAADCLPATFTMVKASAPQEVDVVVDGMPLTVRVLRDGEPAGLSGVQWRRDRFAGNYGTDEHGVLRQLVLDEPLRLRAVSMDKQQASEWLEFAKGTIPQELVLQLQPIDGERVVVRLDGAVLDHVGFDWSSPSDPSLRRSTSAMPVDGAYVMRVPAGAQRLRVIGVRGRPSEFLLPTEVEVTLPLAGELVVPVRLGGRLRLAVTDAGGEFVGGRYRLLQNGQVVAPSRSPRHDTAPPSPRLLPAGGEHFSDILAPGAYELVLDLGAHGESRRTVEIAAGKTTDVRITLP